MGNEVVNIPNLMQSNHDIPPRAILERVLDTQELQDVVIVGWDKDGQLYYNASMANGPEALWLLKQAEKFLLEEP